MHKLLYFGDPMCSWCYGLMKPLEQLMSTYKDEVELELIMGGLRPGGGEQWDLAFREMLRSHWDHVQKASGQPFSHAILMLDEFNYDTEPACRAVCTIKELHPELTFEFYKKIQHQFYAEGQDPTKPEFYDPLLNALGVDLVKFHQFYVSEEAYSAVEHDFERTLQYKVRGFPTLILDMDDRLFPITYGFSTYAMLKDRLGTYLQQN